MIRGVPGHIQPYRPASIYRRQAPSARALNWPLEKQPRQRAFDDCCDLGGRRARGTAWAADLIAATPTRAVNAPSPPSAKAARTVFASTVPPKIRFQACSFAHGHSPRQPPDVTKPTRVRRQDPKKPDRPHRTLGHTADHAQVCWSSPRPHRHAKGTKAVHRCNLTSRGSTSRLAGNIRGPSSSSLGQGQANACASS